MAKECLHWNRRIQSTISRRGRRKRNGVPALRAELEEATTDPGLNAWYDVRGYENADKCAWSFGTSRTDQTCIPLSTGVSW